MSGFGPLRKVLVVINPEEERQPALEKCLYLAKQMDMDLRLVASDYTEYLVEGYYFDPVNLPGLRAEYLESRKEKLEALAAPLREQGLRVETESLWSQPGYEGVVADAVHWDADLVIYHPTRSQGALSRLILTNEDWALARYLPMPLLLVKDKDWDAQPTILASVDPMHKRAKPDGLDHKLMEHAMGIASALAGTVHAVHSYRQVPLSGTYVKEAEQTHAASMARLMNDFDVSEANVHLSDESPELTLNRLEKELDTAIIVMGAVSRSRLSEALIGSTTERAVAYLNSDILVIKPDEFVSPLSLDSGGGTPADEDVA